MEIVLHFLQRELLQVFILILLLGAQIASQSLSFNTTTKIDYTSELQDTNTAYDTSNKRFTVPTGLGGTYMIGSWYRIGSSTDVEAFTIIPYVNGSALDSNRQLRSSMVQRNSNTYKCQE